MTEAHEDEDALPPGTELGDYVIDAMLGRGGFAITYRGHHQQITGQLVAIKEYFPETLARRSQHGEVRSTRAEFADGRAEFLAEGQRLAAIRHPNVVRLINFFQANGTAYLVMDLERGLTLEQRIKADRRWPEARVRALATKLLDALRVVHEGGLLHRDINPSNLIIRDDGEPVLIDFGAARSDLAQRTRAVTSVVTDGYSPSEQYGSNARAQGPWTDLYALGATLYQVTTGRRPVSAPDRVQALTEGQPDPLLPAASLAGDHYDAGLLHWIDELLSIQRNQRPQSAGEALRAMRAVARPRSPATQRTRHVDEGARWGTPSTPTGARAPQSPTQTERDAPQNLENERWDGLSWPAKDVTHRVRSRLRRDTGGRNRIAVMGVLLVVVVGVLAWALGIGDRQAPTSSLTSAGARPTQEAPPPSRQDEAPAASPPSRPEPTATAPLTIVTTPANAKVRVLNVGPAYRTGMMLEPGRYRIEVSAQGYQTHTETVQLGSDGLNHPVALAPAIEAAHTTTTEADTDGGATHVTQEVSAGYPERTQAEIIRYKKVVPPRYPPQAIRQSQGGAVIVEVWVGSDGRPITISVHQSSGYPLLDMAAIEAVEAWEWNPVAGRKPTMVRFPVSFNLDKGPDEDGRIPPSEP